MSCDMQEEEGEKGVERLQTQAGIKITHINN